MKKLTNLVLSLAVLNGCGINIPIIFNKNTAKEHSEIDKSINYRDIVAMEVSGNTYESPLENIEESEILKDVNFENKKYLIQTLKKFNNRIFKDTTLVLTDGKIYYNGENYAAYVKNNYMLFEISELGSSGRTIMHAIHEAQHMIQQILSTDSHENGCSICDFYNISWGQQLIPFQFVPKQGSKYVSEYAEAYPAEDFAESGTLFVASSSRFLDMTSNEPQLKSKYDFFSKIYGKKQVDYFKQLDQVNVSVGSAYKYFKADEFLQNTPDGSLLSKEWLEKNLK